MNIIKFETIDSTNKYCKENNENLPSFSFVISKFQSEGKGRNNRVWTANSGENLLFSLIIKENNLLENFSFLSIGAACIVAEYLESLGVMNVEVKWPNDVYIDGKKVCGILLEGNVEKYIVIGIGINVNQKEFLGEYRVEPTSVCIELNRDISIDDFSINLFEKIERTLRDSNLKQKFIGYVNSHNYLYGKYVNVRGNIGKVTGISNNGYLLVDDIEIVSGEVTIL